MVLCSKDKSCNGKPSHAFGGHNKTHPYPVITGRVVSDTERELFALPPRLGGLGIKNPVQEADNEYEASRSLAGPLCEKIFQNDSLYDVSVIDNQKKAMQG